jgi:two-component system sensor histidine kinase KdpD
LQASEKLHSALLNSVSHDLRIPLVSIQGALTTLQEKPAFLDEERRRALIDNALSETDRLNRLVGNLLQKTRLETGHLTLKLLPCEVEDLVSTTIGSLVIGWREGRWRSRSSRTCHWSPWISC